MGEEGKIEETAPSGYTLTLKQERFCQEYLIDGNATRAAKTAGFSEDTAGQIGYQLLQKTSILARIDELQADRMARTRITQDWVLVKLKQNAERAMQAEQVFDAEGKPTGEYVYQGQAANKALELLGKAQGGMFIDRKEISGPNGGPLDIVTAMTPEQRKARIDELERKRRDGVPPVDGD